MRIDRRDFLKIVGAGTATIAFGGVLSNFTEFAEGDEAALAESFKQTVCGICDSECALRIRVVGDKAVEITGIPDGDADIPSGGHPCVKALASYRFLYDPDRLKGPLMRTNPERGRDVDPGWKEVSYEEAYAEIGKRLKAISDTNGPESIVCVMRPKTEMKHFYKALGTPNQTCHVDTCYVSHEVAWHVTAGGMKPPTEPGGKSAGPIGKPWVWDYKNSKYILGFGYDMLGKSKRVFARGVQQGLDAGAKMVIFDPRLSITASKADEWIPIKPGTDLAVALAMMNVIINEDLYDQEFVTNYVHGLEELRAHVQQYDPEWAAGISDVPAETIARIAREFATTKPAVVAEHKRDAGGPLKSQSFDLARAMAMLNALVGSVDRLGGPLWSRHPKMPDDLQKMFGFTYPEPRTTKRVDGLEQWPLSKPFGKASFSNLAEGILSKQPYETKAFLIHKYNLTTFPNPQRMEEALKTVDLVVTWDVVLSEMAQYSDFVLPGKIFLEDSGWTARDYSAYYPQIAIKEGVDVLELPKLGESFNEILKAMGKSEFVIDWKKFSATRLEALGLTRDDIAASPNGIWKDEKPFTPKTEFGTPTGKVELYSTMLEEKGYDPLPSWREPKYTPGEGEFYFVTTHLPWIRMGNPMQTNDEIIANLQPENYCWINRGKATEMGIADGDLVELTSQTGFPIRVKARLIEGIRPDTIMTEHGYGQWSKGKSVAQGRGTDDGELSPVYTVEEKLANNDPSCGAAFLDFTVKVAKV